MYNIKDVAKALLSKSEMSHKKLQKLAYYSQCWNLYFNNKEILADTKFQAWVHGPVSPELYEEYKVFGYDEIPQLTQTYKLNDREQIVIDSVYNAYGKFSGNELESITHSELPWQKARKDLEPYEASNEVISIDDMYDYCLSIMNKSQADV